VTTSADLLAIPNDDNTFFVALDAVLQELPTPLRPVGQAFRTNLESVARIISVPYRMAHLTLAPDVRQEMRERFKRAWNQKSDAAGLLGQLQAKADALKRTLEEQVQEVIPSHRNKAITRAREALSNVHVELGVREIFLQSLVLSWGALEVVANDVFVALVDTRPELSVALLRDESCRRLFNSLRIDVELLAEYQFNLASSMGQLLSATRPVDNVEVMKTVFGKLFPKSSELREALASRELWLLNCRRHLIVHRRGVVDDQYLRRSGDTLEPGSRLEVSLDDVRAAIIAVRDVALALLPAAASMMEGDVSTPANPGLKRTPAGAA
jgi:hypothetical protein